MAASRARPSLDPSVLERALSAWREHDVKGAIHPVDRDAIRATEAARALVLELFAGPPRDLYNACARLGRLLADAGASPSLVACTIDGAANALDDLGLAHDPSRLAPARASVAEGYVAAVREAERTDARRAWDYATCVVPVDAETVAIAAGYPADDGEALAEWTAMVAAKAARSGARVAIVAGPDATKRELADALRLVGIETKGGGAPARRWLRLPWRKRIP